MTLQSRIPKLFLTRDNIPHEQLYLEITNAHDCILLQKALDVVEAWARDWQLQLSVEKCNLLHIGACLDNCRYHIGQLEIQSKTECKDLGIVITNDLSPQQHINEITA